MSSKTPKTLTVDWLTYLNFFLPIPLILLVFSLTNNHEYKFKITNDEKVFMVDSFTLIDSTKLIYFNTNGTTNTIEGKIKIDTIK